MKQDSTVREYKSLFCNQQHRAKLVREPIDEHTNVLFQGTDDVFDLVMNSLLH